MTVRDLLAMLFERGNAMQTFWGFYITVSLGLIAFLSGAKLGPRLRQVALVITAGFIGFAYVNCDGMTGVARQRRFLHQRLATVSRSDTVARALFDSVAVDSLVVI